MKYQLVVQFPDTFFETFDALVAFEDRLRVHLPRTHEVDGHDIGSGTTNFFVFTDSPNAAHKVIHRVTTAVHRRHMRVAYRSTRGSTFTNLWPYRDERPFNYTYAEADNPFTAASKRKIPKRRPRASSK